MFKKRKLINRIITITFYVLIIGLFGVSAQKYSQHIGLFEEFEVQINGNEFISDTAIQDRLNPHLDQSLLSLKLDEIQSSIVNLDFIETVQVSRVLPNTLVIQVVERSPLLLVNVEGENLFLDAKGVVLPAENRSISFFPVPLVTILENHNLEPDPVQSINEFFGYILKDYPQFYDNLSEVIIDEEKWTFYSDNKTRIFAASKNLISQFYILKHFERTVYPKRRLADYSYIDLRVEDQVVVKEKIRRG